MNVETSIVRQYNVNGLLQALRDELQPIIDRAQASHIDTEKAQVIATYMVHSAATIDSLLDVLGQLTDQQLHDLLKKDGDN